MHETHEDPSALTHLYHLFSGHAVMLSDGVRNKAFYEALRRRITPDCTVLDIGSGTGLWAIVASRLGARRVLAVERDEYLVPIIRNLARANGVEDQVEVVQGDSRELTLEETFDVIVSETIGNQGFDEQIISTMLDARSRLLKPDGALIPQSVVLMAAPAHVRGGSESTPAGISLDYGYFETMRMNLPARLTDRSRLELLSSPQQMLRIDFAAIESPPDLGKLSARWILDDTTRLNCFVVWAEAALTEDIEISTMQADSWTPITYSVERFKSDRGEVDLVLSQSERIHYWSVTLSNDGEKETQSYSPVFAFTSLQAQR